MFVLVRYVEEEVALALASQTINNISVVVVVVVVLKNNKEIITTIILVLALAINILLEYTTYTGPVSQY